MSLSFEKEHRMTPHDVVISMDHQAWQAGYAAGLEGRSSISPPELDPKPAFMLKPVVGGKSITMVDASVADLLKEPMAINVHESATDLKKYVACGDIVAPK